jgi:hypothetical protein
MIPKQKKYLIRLIRETLAKDGNITIYGWIDLNHDSITRAYGRTERIHFVERRDKVVGVKGNLVIFTKFISHADQQKMPGKINFYSYPIEIRDIKDILVKCSDLIVKKKVHAEVQHFDLDEKNPDPAPMDLNELEKFILQTEVKVDKYDKLARLFVKDAETHPDNLVSTSMIGKILQTLNSEGLEPPLSVKELVSQGWIVPVKKEGKMKVGWYKAGENLQARINADNQDEPADDAIEKALFLRKRRPFFEEKLAELDKEREILLAELDARRASVALQLERCDKSEDLLAQILKV